MQPITHLHSTSISAAHDALIHILPTKYFVNKDFLKSFNWKIKLFGD